jgi:hypothetical protein
VRIAAHRSTISTSAAAPETSSKPTGASFLEVLAGTSAQSSSGNASPSSNVVRQRDSDAGDQNNQPDSTAKTQGQDQDRDQAQAKADPVQSAAAQVTSRTNAAQVIAPQPQTRSNASGVSRTTERQEKTPANSAAPVTNGALPAAAAPVELAPIAALPVPSPSSSAQSEDNAGTQKGKTTDGIAQAQEQDDTNRGGRVAQVADSSQYVPGTPDTKAVTECSDADQAPIQSDSALSGSTACVTGFSLPAGVTAIAVPLSSMALSGADFLPGMSDASQSTANAGQSSKTSATSLSKSTMATAAGPNQTASLAASSAASAGASAHSAQSAAQSNPTAQHGQSPAAPAAPATQGQANSAAPLIQAMAEHGATHEGVASHGRADGTAGAARASEQPAQAETSESAGTTGINTANVIQKMNETEMRVGMHSAEFGEISIRTSVSQQQMTAQISVDDGDLGKAISAHIPAMEAKLGGEFGLRALVQVSQGGMSFSGERGNSPQKEQGSYAPPAQVESIPAFVESDSAATRVAAAAIHGYRLDIRA